MLNHWKNAGYADLHDFIPDDDTELKLLMEGANVARPEVAPLLICRRKKADSNAATGRESKEYRRLKPAPDHKQKGLIGLTEQAAEKVGNADPSPAKVGEG